MPSAQASALLEPADFYAGGHEAIFRAPQSLHEDNVDIDPLSLREELKERGWLEAAGGLDYIGGLISVA